MKRILILCLPLTLLAGCLEVDQHPNWVHGMYAGKKDDRPFLRHFHNDKLSWWGTISNRNMHQNEYNRANP
ncbi:hypothetical protein IA69_01830 [Massilia sp. JS1662]|nr:hypothetical protein [Massilia sp. JS1662]KGF83008.1 hypothetical protein IA69_01830 [Massilia sp. JS1662]